MVEAFYPNLVRELLSRLHDVVGRIRNRLTQADAALDAEPPTPPKVFRAELAGWLDKQVAAARRRGLDPGSEIFLKTRAIAAEIADQKLESFTWWGRDAWSTDRLAKTYAAPEETVDLLAEARTALAETAGVEPDQDAAAEAVARLEVLLLTLAAGFPIEQSGEERICSSNEIRRLSERLAELAPPPSSSTRLFPDAEPRRRRAGPLDHLPGVRRWFAVAAILLGLYLFFSMSIWGEATAPVDALVKAMATLVDKVV